MVRNILIEREKNVIIKKQIRFFLILSLLGVFLAKGSNEPFGQIYIWLFEHIPGFVMFRDPTKWYMLIAVSYSVLIPYSIYKIVNIIIVEIIVIKLRNSFYKLI